MSGQAGSEFTKWGYPPVPAPGADYEPSAPPLPPAEAHAYDLGQPAAKAAAAAPPAPALPASKQQRGKQAKQQQQPSPAVPKGVAIVSTPKIEAQPWVGGRGAAGPRGRIV